MLGSCKSRAKHHFCSDFAFVQGPWIRKLLSKYYAGKAKSQLTDLPMTHLPPAPETPRFEAYCLKPITFFYPHRQFPSIVPSVPCAVVGCLQTTQLKSHSRPRWIYGLHGMELFISSVHWCPVHKKEFAASEILHRLPPVVRNALPVVLNSSSGLTKRC